MEAVLFRNEADKEAHFRTSIEPQLDRNIEHPAELYRLVNEPRFAELAGRLCVEWLEAFPNLSARTQRELLVCALKNGSRDAVKGSLVKRRTSVGADDETRRLWLSADFVIDFENRSDTLYVAAAEDPRLIWPLRDRIGPERRERGPRLSLSQHVFIVEAFGRHWRAVERPPSYMRGSDNPWDASEFIRRTIDAIAQDPSPNASEALDRLIHEGHAPTYVNTMRHALALQRKARRDREYTAPSLGELLAVMANKPPESVKDMRAYLEDRIETVQVRIHGSDTNMWEAFWAGGKPQGEDFCRNRLIEKLSAEPPSSIRFVREMSMPAATRADIAVIRGSVGLPVEIKGQWNRDVWTAAVDQLDAKYTRDWHAEGRGAYVVLWFGNVPRKNLPGHPDGLPRPKTPGELEKMLIDRIPEARRSDIDVFVIDVSRLEKDN